MDKKKANDFFRRVAEMVNPIQHGELGSVFRRYLKDDMTPEPKETHLELRWITVFHYCQARPEALPLIAVKAPTGFVTHKQEFLQRMKARGAHKLAPHITKDGANIPTHLFLEKEINDYVDYALKTGRMPLGEGRK